MIEIRHNTKLIVIYYFTLLFLCLSVSLAFSFAQSRPSLPGFLLNALLLFFFRFFATTYAHSSSPLLCMFQCVGLLCFFLFFILLFFTPNALIWVLCLHVTHTLIPIFCNYFGKKVYIYTTKRHRIISSFADLTSTNYVLFF